MRGEMSFAARVVSYCTLIARVVRVTLAACVVCRLPHPPVLCLCHQSQAFDKDIDGDDAEKPEKPSRGKYAAADERAPGKGAMAAEGKPPISGVSGKGKRGGDDLGDALARQDSVPKSPRKDAKTVAASADEAKKARGGAGWGVGVACD